MSGSSNKSRFSCHVKTPPPSSSLLNSPPSFNDSAKAEKAESVSVFVSVLLLALRVTEACGRQRQREGSTSAKPSLLLLIRRSDNRTVVAVDFQ